MKRILTAIITAVAPFSVSAESDDKPGASSSPPNIVFFLADDHGINECSAYGQTQARTPFMNALAKQGLRFDNAFIASPACGPSRAALLSGLMPARNGAEANHQAPRPGTQKMVRLMKKAGYEVVAFGKVAHGKAGRFSKFDFIDRRPKGSLSKRVDTYLTDRKSDKPLFLLVGDRRPHVPWIKKSAYDRDKLKLPPYLIDTPETRDHWSRYLTDVSGMDSEMAAVDRVAQKHFGNDDFIFLYSSDHGAQWPFGKWNLYDAGTRVPLLARWPGRIKPGAKTDAMVSWVDIFPTLIDIAGLRTPKGIDGRSFADVLLGKSESHRDVIFTTHTSDKKMNVYPIRAIRDQRFKYIRNLSPGSYHSNHSDILRKDGAGAYWDSWDEKAKTDPDAAAIIKRYYRRPPEEFYDLASDPQEVENLIDDPKHAKTIAKMRADLDAWMKAQGDKGRMFAVPYPLSGPTPHRLGVRN